jgi:hypothetical protein
MVSGSEKMISKLENTFSPPKTMVETTKTALPACFSTGLPAFQKAFKKRDRSRACGNVGKSRRVLARLFQAAVGIRVFCGFPRTRHFRQAIRRTVVTHKFYRRPKLFNPFQS